LHVTVEYNASSYAYFFAPVFVEFPSLKQSLLDDFAAYKATGKLPEYFGRDTGYERPSDIIDAELMHLHLALGSNAFSAPPNGANLSDPKTAQWHRTSNTALVYSQNLIDENRYSLIALFHPVAHMSANNDDRMRVLAQYSRDFRSSFPL
jgi:mRNA interferase YafO